ncbi:MAG: hypothetical protein UY21_C0014G0034 [Microgenomates group bacterium GW2011_GWA1_48_10]|nr:MAG: hypothetical protein UY21_C0014G0034 [Microgenomates group bacterium GW2011_GWA1_48_10]
MERVVDIISTLWQHKKRIAIVALVIVGGVSYRDRMLQQAQDFLAQRNTGTPANIPSPGLTPLQREETPPSPATPTSSRRLSPAEPPTPQAPTAERSNPLDPKNHPDLRGNNLRQQPFPDACAIILPGQETIWVENGIIVDQKTCQEGWWRSITNEVKSYNRSVKNPYNPQKPQ